MKLELSTVPLGAFQKIAPPLGAELLMKVEPITAPLVAEFQFQQIAPPRLLARLLMNIELIILPLTEEVQ